MGKKVFYDPLVWLTNQPDIWYLNPETPLPQTAPTEVVATWSADSNLSDMGKHSSSAILVFSHYLHCGQNHIYQPHKYMRNSYLNMVFMCKGKWQKKRFPKSLFKNKLNRCDKKQPNMEFLEPGKTKFFNRFTISQNFITIYSFCLAIKYSSSWAF